MQGNTEVQKGLDSEKKPTPTTISRRQRRQLAKQGKPFLLGRLKQLRARWKDHLSRLPNEGDDHPEVKKYIDDHLLEILKVQRGQITIGKKSLSRIVYELERKHDLFVGAVAQAKKNGKESTKVPPPN